MIEISHLNKVWRSGARTVTALDDVSLRIAAGSIFGIIGRSGAGKSTLLRTLNLLERPTSGSIRMDGQEITTLPHAELLKLRQQTGMIFQHFNLLAAKTVFDNIAWPLKATGLIRDAGARRARVLELLDLVGLSEHADKYPAQLSGGQKQRVGIARALASRPKLLLCDEATSALDPETTQSILALLADINRTLGLTIILITHEMQVIRDLCDEVAVIEQGSIIEQGSVADIFLHPRHEVTRALVAQSDPLLATILNPSRLGVTLPGLLVHLTYSGETTWQPILSQICACSPAQISILQGEVSMLKDTPYGQLLLGIQGEAADVAQIFNILDEHQVFHEIIPARTHTAPPAEASEDTENSEAHHA